MRDPNDALLIAISRAALRRMVEEAWHDSAATTADRLIDAVEARTGALLTVGDGPFHAGAWTHIFDEDGTQVERVCEIVLADNGRRMVAMTITRDQKERDATQDEMDDLMESLHHNDVPGSPEDWDLEQLESLPSWAADQIVERGPPRADAGTKTARD